MEKTKVRLSSQEKTFLRQYITNGNHPARSICRARMLLMLDETIKNHKQTAHDCQCSRSSVTNLINRYRDCKAVVKEVPEEKPVTGQPTIVTPELGANITIFACCCEEPDGRS